MHECYNYPIIYKQLANIDNTCFIYKYYLLFMIIQRIKELMRYKGLKVDDLALQTHIGYSRWANVLSGKAKIRHEEVEALGKAFPELKHWIAFGETLPESGQLSPCIAEKQQSYSKD